MKQNLPSQKQRNSTIDFLKFLFALVVVIYHGRKLVSGDEVALLQSGYLAVEFFFLVSGYLMMKSASRVSSNAPIGHETFRFLSHKIRGMYPSILFAFVATFIVLLCTSSKLDSFGNTLTSIWEISLLRMSGIKGQAVNAITWYISAMLIAMLALYPLILKFRKNFAYIIAPLAVIFLFGYLSQTGSLAGPERWMGLVYRGILRALGGLCLGCICYEVAESLRKISFTPFARVLFLILQWACILVALGIMQIPSAPKPGSSQLGYVCILFLAVAVTIAFSGVTRKWNPPPRYGILWNKICSWLGAFSLPLYLNHIYLRHIFRYALKLPYDYGTQLILYILSSVGAALIAMYVVKGIQRLLSKTHYKKLRRIVDDSNNI